MKKSLVCGMGLLLCLMSGVFTGCEDKEKETEKGNSAGFGSLEGVVTDKATEEAIAMASVELLSAGRKTQTDESGAFSFTDVEAGVYRVRVRKGGYVDYTTLDLAVTAGSKVMEIIQMEEVQTDLQILDTNDMAMRVLYLEDGARKGVFKIKNTGSAIVEWEIPKLADGWLGAFSKQSGKLGPGASEKIEFTIINEFRLSEGENKMVVYIASPSGDKQLQVVYLLKNRFYVETAFGMEMPLVEVKGGTFEMGATPEQGDDVRDNEKPVHNVSLSPFYIGKYEVTQAQWEAVMGTTVEQHRAWAEAERLYDGMYCLAGVGPENPMYYVSWKDAVAFCSKLSERTGKKYRLPTEAEWEYAARGGHHHDGTMYAGSDVAYEVAWYLDNANGIDGGTRPVGQKKPNGLGIYDMSGNVSERCSDWYDKAYYGVSPAHNPQGPAEGTSRVLRGGYFASRADLHVSFREGGNPRYRLHWIGFRVVCEL